MKSRWDESHCKWDDPKWFNFIEEMFGDEIVKLRSSNMILPIITPSFKNNWKDKLVEGSPEIFPIGVTNPKMQYKIKHNEKNIYANWRLHNRMVAML